MPAKAPLGKRKRSQNGEGSSAVPAHLVHLSYSYEDLGDCDQVCEFFSARFWYSERSCKSLVKERPRYTICCRSKKVHMTYPINPPRVIKELFGDKAFLQNVRRYNSMFAMTSFGAKIDKDINKGSAPPIFKVSGQVSHVLGSLCPGDNAKPKFLQLYIYDTLNEVSNRLSIFEPEVRSKLCPAVIQTLIHTLDRCNSLVKLFRTESDLCAAAAVPEFDVWLNHDIRVHPYQSPTEGTLGAIIYDADPTAKDFDIVVRTKDDMLQRVNILHPCYMSLQYPLLFPLGETGWTPDMKLVLPEDSGDKRLTLNMYYSYQIQDRPHTCTHILHGGRLFQQYLVDAYVSIERNRLDYIQANQSSLRTDFLNAIHDAIERGDTEGNSIGQRIILPSSFTGEPRYMYKHYQDALAICRVHGNPQYFITFTCNVKWPEIKRCLEETPLLKPEDRPQVIARVFRMKVQAFIAFLRKEQPFGVVVAGIRYAFAAR